MIVPSENSVVVARSLEIERVDRRSNTKFGRCNTESISNRLEETPIEPTPEQLQAIGKIARQYQNLHCMDCAPAIQDYLLTQGIPGKKSQLYTGDSVGRDSYIYDDSVGGDAISTNGYHAGIEVVIQNQEIVFDNHHPNGIDRDTWLANLMFPSRLYFNRSFQITEITF